jgi:hypothetical protein
MKHVPLSRYRVSVDPDLLRRIDPHEYTFEMVGYPGQTFRAAELGSHPVISRILLGAFIERYGALGRGTRATRWVHVGAFVDHLAHDGEPDDVASLDEALLKRYLLAVKRKDWAAKTKHSSFKTAEELVVLIARRHGKLVRRTAAPFPGIRRAGNPTPRLSPLALVKIIAAAKREADDVWETFTSAPSVDPSSRLGEILSIITSKYGGIVPKSSTERNFSRRCLNNAEFSVESLSRYLCATPDSLLPFLILIAYETAANADPLRAFKRNCVHDDVLFRDRAIIVWEKGRAKKEQRVSRDRRGKYSAPALIAKVRAMTEPLLQAAPPHLRSRLFLARNGKAEGLVAGISPSLSEYLIARFITRNNVTEEDGSRVHFTLEMMRPSVLAAVYRQTGDLLATARLANHVSLATTIRYVIDRITDEMHDIAIADMQRRFNEIIQEGETDDSQQDQAATSNARRESSDCRNPYAAPFSRRPGEVCPSWLWPLNDPGLVVADDPDVVVHHVRHLRALEARRDLIPMRRFDLLYGDAYRIIRDDILTRMSPATIAAANAAADLLPPLPVFESD